MPLQPWMKLISVDDHLVEHPKVWADRLPAKYLESGPRIVEEASEGIFQSGRMRNPEERPPAQVWVYEGRRYPYIGINAVAGKRPEEYGIEPIRYSDMIPGCYDPVARLADMDLDGVWGAMCFPSFPHFAGSVFLKGKDTQLALLCVQAYNDFVVDEWCATAPDRFIPCVFLPLWDVEAAIGEVQRTAAKGAKAISFPDNPASLGLPSFHSDHWDPLFSAIEETGMPLCMHFGSSAFPPPTSKDAPFAVMIVQFGIHSQSTAADLLFSPVFHRHPALKVALSEGGIGWIPWLVERADYTWEKHRFYQNINQDTRPSEIFRRNFFGCFIEDNHGVEARHKIGIENITWECDYPHSDSWWPHSRKRAEDVLRDVPDEEAHMIVELNARRLYNFGLDA